MARTQIEGDQIKDGTISAAKLGFTPTTVAGSSGAVQFNSSGALGADTANFFWDDSLNRLGLGTNTPSFGLDLAGTARITATARIEDDLTMANISNGIIKASTYSGAGHIDLVLKGGTSLSNGSGSNVSVGGPAGTSGSSILMRSSLGLSSSTPDGSQINIHGNSDGVYGSEAVDIYMNAETDHGSTAPAYRFDTGSTEKMRVTYQGNLLINTTTDDGNKLQVNGVIESKTGGFKFPDGSTMTASSGSGTTGFLAEWATSTSLTDSLIRRLTAIYTSVDGLKATGGFVLQDPSQTVTSYGFTSGFTEMFVIGAPTAGSRFILAYNNAGTATQQLVIENQPSSGDSTIRNASGTTARNLFIANPSTHGSNSGVILTSATGDVTKWVTVAPSGFTCIKGQTPSEALDVRGNIIRTGYDTTVGSSVPAVSAASNGRMYFDSSTNHFYFSENTGSYLQLGSVTGSGTADKLPKFTGSRSIGDSFISDDGSLIKLGDATYSIRFLEDLNLTVNSGTKTARFVPAPSAWSIEIEAGQNDSNGANHSEIRLLAGDGISGKDGGRALIESGSADASNAGHVVINGGSGAAGGSGGSILVTAGNGAGGGDSGGNVTLTPGTGSTVGNVIVASDRVRVTTSHTPSSATDTGTTGDIAWDSGYIYVCTASNTWVRAALSTW